MNKACEEFNQACEYFLEIVLDDFNIPTLVHLWNNDLQLWSGVWWWMEVT